VRGGGRGGRGTRPAGEGVRGALKPGFEPGDALVAALQQFVKASIAPYKYPRAIEFVSALPRTETGKLQRFALRKMA